MKAVINKEMLNKALDGRSIKWLLSKINNMGINISYSAFYHLTQNTNEWKLTYALAISKILNFEVEKLFHLED